MTHSHPLDLDIVAEALRVDRFGYVGLIGSRPNGRGFEPDACGGPGRGGQLAHLVCPIGVSGINSKDPAVIAASTAAQLLIVSENLAAEERARDASLETVRRLRRLQRRGRPTSVLRRPSFLGLLCFPLPLRRSCLRRVAIVAPTRPRADIRRARALALINGAYARCVPRPLWGALGFAVAPTSPAMRPPTSAPFDFIRSRMRPTSSSESMAGRPSERAIA